LRELPAGWTIARAWGPGPFVTHAVLRRPDGTQTEWTSRRHRKRLGTRPVGGAAVRRLASGLGTASATSWAMGAGFAVGSLCFAAGSFPLYFERVEPSVVAWTFFVGSVFFTTAAYLQFHEVLHSPAGVELGSPRPSHLRSLLGWRPRSIDWWATAVQFVGTIFFNITTFAATRADLDLDQQKRLIWAPDVVGSICFLVASWLAYAEVNRGILPRSDRSFGWRIAALNLFGSIAFGVAAVASRYLRTTGEIANIRLVNLGTFLGAVGFFLGALLLPVESASDRTDDR
jgi:hypothetical protein